MAPGIGPGTWFRTYTTNIPIVAGDYYFTIYGDGGTTQDNILNWSVGGEKQDPSLEQNFIWRSQNFPDPGFVNYNPGTIEPGPDAVDPLAIWNTCFTLWERGTAPICPNRPSMKRSHATWPNCARFPIRC